ncbi:ParB/RepB/Spo0J family partition protein [Propionivibrio dicarboxylicus]|uniref:Chromosome partitioning protein, ParB family n=1 Tax=Propionivibrio dicarboxylicus TaxID=83767 RepID=A0A1G8EV61_9RHOO|nr:ParB/RepB/Spo0J family partition protein [Propionivibrio dicarboxylicus]SDH73599.1 chromosome partitioning protein, ParB family [Propionivibrio dicarboxylicus]
MSKISEKDLAAGLRNRRNPRVIEEEVRSSTVMGQMINDALRIPIAAIRPSPFQVREVTEQAIEDLMSSIVDTDGLISPVIVRPVPEGCYELIAGHTRYEACKRLGHTDIPAIVRQFSDQDAARALAADNLAREDLSDYEIFKQLKSLFELGFVKSNSEASSLIGRTRQDVIRYNCFGKLPSRVLEMLEANKQLLGASAAQAICVYPAEKVVEGCERLASGKFRTQQELMAWLIRPAVSPHTRQETRVLDKAGKTIGKLNRGIDNIKITAKGIDFVALEKALQAELEKQGFRF